MTTTIHDLNPIERRQRPDLKGNPSEFRAWCSCGGWHGEWRGTDTEAREDHTFHELSERAKT